MKVKFGEWLPDQPDLANEGALTAKNCFPAKDSYRPLAGLTVYSGALTERPLGSTAANDTSSNTNMFVGSTTKLWKLQTDTTWADVSIAGGYTNADYWEFTQVGNRVIAVSLTDNLQSYVLGTSSLFANLVSDLKAKHVASSEEFVMVGNTYDTTDGNVPHRVRWSAIGDETDWTVSASTQSDFENLNSTYGKVTSVKYNGDFYAFQEKAITRLSYVGSPAVFNVDTFETARGTKYPGSVCVVGKLIFFLAEDGFYVLNYSESVPIGADKVNKYFFSNLHDTYADRIRASVDPINNLVFWAYPSTGGGGKLDKMLIFNWVTNRWSETDYFDLTHLGRASSLGYTLEDLDNISSSIDTLPFSLDSRAWKGGEESLVGFNTDWKMVFFTGDTIPATVTTKEIQIGDGRARLRRLRPLVDGTVTAKVGTRNLQSDSVTWSTSYSTNSTGDIPVRENAFYHQIELTTTGNFNHIQGVDVLEFSEGGRR